MYRVSDVHDSAKGRAEEGRDDGSDAIHEHSLTVLSVRIITAEDQLVDTTIKMRNSSGRQEMEARGSEGLKEPQKSCHRQVKGEQTTLRGVSHRIG